ncbi:MAG: hypothetical protein DIZ80_12000 [endosymbiont of Galathealinum brachiosum]|uniref:Phosphate/phosphite/phosphonate ABC transporter substrate-binding protein n=1 Tax=endosymbiont of Galathealinum brachiosum TaxID=2200906 RepID=A0A370DDJ9_9GAMM|nr:MAG: hypothetical protein DIZ80_12000 [endosymbiont of Galathealinum brachiosum]
MILNRLFFKAGGLSHFIALKLKINKGHHQLTEMSYTYQMKKIILSGSLLFILFTNTCLAEQNGNCTKFTPMTFGILPFVSAKQLVIRFTPMANYLSQHLNTQVRIETAPSFIEFGRRTVVNKRYDILFTAPHFYPHANEAGYQLIASVDSPGMKAVIVVPKQSPVKNINDLRGKRLATVDAKSLATLLIKKHLLKNKINPAKDLKIIFTPTHNASLLSSYHGITDASALMQPPYEAASKQVRDNMRIITTTERGPHIPISVGDRISDACADEISTLLLTMSSNIEGKQVLKHNRFSGFKKARISEYEKIKNQMLRP